MSLNAIPLLSIIMFLPLLGALVVLILPGEENQKWWSLLVTTLTFLLSLALFFYWKNGEAGFQFVERYAWIPQLGIDYHLGVDGISLFLVLLTTFLGPLTILFSWDIKDRLKTYLFLMLLQEAGVIGVFISLDMVLFYLFWELTLIPMYFLIGLWGGPRRVYAAVKFFIYTMLGSTLMIIAILALRYFYGSFDFVDLLHGKGLPATAQLAFFGAFALAFAIKVPLFPFHTWLPDAHVQAPTAGSVVLAGVLLKMGTYGLVRFCLPLFPAATKQMVPVMMTLAIIGILYAALVALRQKDLKGLVAYSSIAHLGFVVLGIFALNPSGISGAVLQMVNHGVSTGGLFFLVGMLYHRAHRRMVADFGGLWKQLPVFGAFFLVIMLSSIGLPGLNGFVGEFNILIGAFKASKIAAFIATIGIIFAAWYLLYAFRQVMEGPLDKPENKLLPDLNAREIIILASLVAVILLIGLFPNIFFAKINPSVLELVHFVKIHAAPVLITPLPTQ